MATGGESNLLSLSHPNPCQFNPADPPTVNSLDIPSLKKIPKERSEGTLESMLHSSDQEKNEMLSWTSLKSRWIFKHTAAEWISYQLKLLPVIVIEKRKKWKRLSFFFSFTFTQLGKKAVSYQNDVYLLITRRHGKENFNSLQLSIPPTPAYSDSQTIASHLSENKQKQWTELYGCEPQTLLPKL